jgi:hypothetical protein
MTAEDFGKTEEPVRVLVDGEIRFAQRIAFLETNHAVLNEKHSCRLERGKWIRYDCPETKQVTWAVIDSIFNILPKEICVGDTSSHDPRDYFVWLNPEPNQNQCYAMLVSEIISTLHVANWSLPSQIPSSHSPRVCHLCPPEINQKLTDQEMIGYLQQECHSCIVLPFLGLGLRFDWEQIQSMCRESNLVTLRQIQPIIAWVKTIMAPVLQTRNIMSPLQFTDPTTNEPIYDPHWFLFELFQNCVFTISKESK